MNIPLSKENTVIKEDWIRYYKKEEIDSIQFDKIVMAVDPATSEKEKADET
jgi:hypothetical protein